MWIAGLALALAIGAGVTAPWGAGKDAVSPQEQHQRIEEFARAGSLHLGVVPAAEVPKALEALPIAPADKARLRAQLDAGSTRLVYVTLWDNLSEDDDRVRIDSGSYSIDVALKNRPIRIAVPEPPSGTLNIVGTRDGGGGITVAMLSGDATVRLPVMQPGQALGVPIVAAP